MLEERKEKKKEGSSTCLSLFMREVPTVVARESSVEKPKKVPSASHEHAYNRMISMGTLQLSSHMHDEDICANIRILWSRNLDRAGRVVEVYQLKVCKQY